MNDFQQLAKKHNLSPIKAAHLLNVKFEKKATSHTEAAQLEKSNPSMIIHNINITSNNIYTGGERLENNQAHAN